MTAAVEQPVEVRRYAAFTDDPAGGNPAGIVVSARPLEVGRMQALAAEVGYSETAFLLPSGPERWSVRYFSPRAEVPFCGHATIAAAVALAGDDGGLTHLELDTVGGAVPVAVERTRGAVRATLTSPSSSTEPVDDELLDLALDCFGWTRAVLDPALPAVVARAGAAHLVLALRDHDDLQAMTYAFDDLEHVSRASGWTTVAVLWREREDLLHARNPFPIGGVVEDPATGAAAAAVGGHLRSLGQLPADGRFTVRQGVDMGRPSTLHVEAPADLAGVRVSGSAVPIEG